VSGGNVSFSYPWRTFSLYCLISFVSVAQTPIIADLLIEHIGRLIVVVAKCILFAVTMIIID
jgi:hypothetical protein